MPRLFRIATSTPWRRSSCAKSRMRVAWRRDEAARAARMQRNQIHERTTLAGELGESDRVLDRVVDAAEHHVLEGHAAIELLRRLDDVVERILHVHGHQLAAQRIARRVNRDREAELLGSLAERDDARAARRRWRR